MITRLTLVSFISALTVQCLTASSEPDHLLPPVRSNHRPYFELLRAKLEDTAFDCGRITVRPPFSGEYSISIHCETTRDTEQCRAVVKIAGDSLWQASSGGVELSKANAVPVSTVDVVVSAKFAHLLKDVLSAMVIETRKLGIDEKPSRVLMEGPLIDISISNDADIIIGEMGYLPATTPKLKSLSRLVSSLTKFCKSEDSQKDQLMNEAMKDAEALQHVIQSHEHGR